MDLAADSRPHFTTIADFISSRHQECSSLFSMIISVCYSQGLIGKNMFAIDGCKISSNCSKEWSGTKAELLNKTTKIEKSVNYLIQKHNSTDENWDDLAQREKENRAIEKLQAKSDKIYEWLNNNVDRIGSLKQPIKSNVASNESAKMSTGHGVLQGYNGIAAVDDKHQLIIFADAYGDINESGHLSEILEGIDESCKCSHIDDEIYNHVTITADTGFHNKKNMQMISPAKHPMWLKTPHFRSNGGRYIGKGYQGYIQHCKDCQLRSKCIRNDHTQARQVAILKEASDADGNNPVADMKSKIDTPFGRAIYSKRMSTVEPVFGHIAGIKKLNRFYSAWKRES
jgi:Transposase DDE domain